jgi:adenine-specific DNA-methyltransferase
MAARAMVRPMTAARSSLQRAPLRAPRGFIRDAGRSYGDVSSDDVVVHGENLDAMRRLVEAGFAGRFRCVYVDAPFNSGRRFAEYEDTLSPSAWRAMMVSRMDAIHGLLSDDGAVIAEIDDTELGPLQVLMDERFGRDQRVSTVTVVRSATTGHKAINRGPVNVTDFLLVYAKDRGRWRCNRLVRARGSYDAAYSTWLENPEDVCEAWRFTPLFSHARRVLGADVARGQVDDFAVEHARHVVRFAQPRYDAVSRAARALIDLSRKETAHPIRLVRKGKEDMVVYRGNRVLFLSNKVATDERGRRHLIEPLTNVWDDVPFQGIAREGGARFVRNKKPEKLLGRILAMATDPGDWVLDPFLGSGTTAAVAHKMNRRWVGIERGDHLDALCLPRLRSVVDGRDATGVTGAFGWKGGGGFHVWT